MASASEAHSEGFATRVIHVGSRPDATTGAVAVPISLSTTFAQSSPGVPPGVADALSYGKGYEYSRTNNPTRAAFEQAVAASEGAAHCCSFASGMAATVAIIHLLKHGEHVVSIDDVYGGTQRYFRRIVAPTQDIGFTFVDFSDAAALEAAIVPGKTKLLWLETPTNPTLKVSDIAAAAEVAHKHGALLAVDNTFMSPYNQNPLALGADMVMHSVTKYINGHSDVVGGVVCVNSDELNTRLRFLQNGMGAVPGPMDAYLALRGLKTLHVRMQRHAENALAIAQLLESHPFVEKALYPGLPSHPQHALACKQTRGHGGMITFYVRGGITGARAFLESIKVFVCAESLGAVESLAESPAVMTHASVPPEQRAKLGISDSLIRLSVGIEDIADLRADVLQALEKAQAAVEAAEGVAGGAAAAPA